jgi:hypothetical protein
VIVLFMTYSDRMHSTNIKMSNIVKEKYVTKTNNCIRILHCTCSSSTYFVE